MNLADNEVSRGLAAIAWAAWTPRNVLTAQMFTSRFRIPDSEFPVGTQTVISSERAITKPRHPAQSLPPFAAPLLVHTLKREKKKRRMYPERRTELLKFSQSMCSQPVRTIVGAANQTEIPRNPSLAFPQANTQPVL